MPFDAQWVDNMKKALIAFKEAAESAWIVLESYGVSVEKLEEVKTLIESGQITRREGWSQLGLPATDYPGDRKVDQRGVI